MTMVMPMADIEVLVRRDRALIRWLSERGQRWMRKNLLMKTKSEDFSISSEHADDFIKDLRQHDLEVVLK